MIKQKFKRVLNGLLAAVMCVSTLTAVSYMQPITASAAIEWYNPALRWLQQDASLTGSVLVANALITEGPAHCINAMCPSNRPDGYYKGVYTDTWGNYIVADDSAGITDEAKWYWTEQDGVWRWARALWDTYEDDDGNEVKYITGYSHESLGGDNTGTTYSRTQMTVYRVPEYTDTGMTGKGGSLDIVGFGVPADFGNRTEGYRSSDSRVYEPGSNGLPKLVSPRTQGGIYTGHHFTATYCESCGIWNSADDEFNDGILNNGNWGLNSCDYFDVKAGQSVPYDVQRTYGHGARIGKNKAGNITSDRDALYHKSLSDTDVHSCKYCFGTEYKDANGVWKSLNEEQNMYLYDDHEFYTKSYQAVSPYAIAISKICNGDAVADYGCGIEVTENYSAENFVNDYIGMVDGEAHYPQGKLAESSLENGGVGVIDGDIDKKTLTATLEWDDDEPPMRIIAGTETKGYTITYSLPAKYIDKHGDLTNSAKDADGKDNIDVSDLTTSVTGVATVTLTPANMSYSNEGNKNYYNNNNASGNSSGILSGLYGNLIANGWNGNVVSGGTTVSSGSTGGVISTSALIDGYDYIIDTDAGIGTYAAYQPSSLDVPDPLNNGNTLHGVFIETGTCNMRGSYNGSSDISHACQYMYSNNGIDYWECIYCNHWLPIKTDSTIVYVHNHVYYKIDEIPATCVAQGKVYRKCVCGDIIIEDTPIDHSNHTGLAHVVSPAATCENDGYEYDQCTGCGTTMNGVMIPKLGHQWSIVGTTQGYGHNASYVTQECSRCNKLQTISSSGTITSGGTISGSGSTVSTSAEHTAHNYVYKYDITEDDKVYQVWQCDVCGDTEKRLLEANGHHYEYKYTENDCTTGTYEIWQCTGCGEIERRMTAAASGHVWVEQSGGRESTCNINGFRNYICSKCGLTKLEMLPLDPNNHQHVSEVLDPAPTCLDAGRSYERCLDCGTNISNTYLAPLGHDYKELLDSDPTCFDKGYNVKQCTRCYEVVTVEKPQLEHHYVETGIINESQCTVDGLSELECEYCKTKKYESVAKTGHTPGPAPTCTEDQTCTVCGAVLAKATGHNYVSNVVAPTCTTMGYTTHRCNVCGDTYVDSYTDTINHDYRVVSTIAPTCTSMGYKVYKCSVCGDEYKADYTDVLAHRYRADVTRPTCVESGYTTYTCMDCGTSYVGDITEPEGHTYRETTVAGNCAEPGHVIATCTKCGESFVKDVGSVTEDHAWNLEETVVPTCTDQGYSKYRCTVCGRTKIDNFVSSNGHNWTVVRTVEPTCVEQGYTEYKCSNCDETKIDNIVEALGHDWVETITDGTCNTPEHRTKTCRRCGEVLVDDVGAITGDHVWVAVETKDATCTNQGYTKYKCDVCGNYKYDDWTDSLGHNYEWVVETEPTFDVPGVRAFKCSVCGDVFDRVEIPMLLSSGYTDEEGKQRVDGSDGSYNVTITDENDRPVMGAEVAVDNHDNVIVTLPDGRVISSDDKITVEVTIADDVNVPATNEPAVNKPVYVYDDKGGLSYGKTDNNGEYIAPSNSSTTGTGNNSAVIADNEGNTYVVTVTDETGRRVPNAVVKIGDSYDIDVTLPVGTQMDEDHRIVVTVTDRDGNPYVNKDVWVDAGRDNQASGITNADGRAVLPYSNQSYTNRDGKAYVNDYIVLTSNTEMIDNEWTENGVIANSLVTVTDDGTIFVKLPSGRYVRNSVFRTTVTVTDRDGSPASNVKVHVYDDTLDRNEELQTGYTNSNGKIMVWPSWWDVQVIDPTDPVIPGVPIDERPIGRADEPVEPPASGDDEEPVVTASQGDINGDGVINHLDAINTMKYFMGMYQADAEYSKDAAEEIWYDSTGKVVFDARVADVFAPDDDHTITHQDAIAMMKYFMGTITSLPVDDTYEPISN